MADDNAKKWIAVGCLASVLVLCCVCGGIAFFVGGIGMIGMEGAQELQTTTDGFFAEVRAKNYTAARSRMGAQYQASHDTAAFTSSVEALPKLATHTEIGALQFQMIDGDVEVGGQLATPTGVGTFVIHYVKAKNRWVIESLTVDGEPLR